MAEILKNSIKIGNTYIQDLKVGSSPVKYVKDWRGNLLYDTLKENVYDDLNVTLTYSNYHTIYKKCPITGGSVTPTISISQTYTKIGHSGDSYAGGTLTPNVVGCLSFTMVEGSAFASVNNQGTVTFSDNTAYPAADRQCKLQVTGYSNGKSWNTTRYFYQAGSGETVTCTLGSCEILLTGPGTVSTITPNRAFAISNAAPYTGVIIKIVVSCSPTSAGAPPAIDTLFSTMPTTGSFHPALENTGPSPAPGVSTWQETGTTYDVDYSPYTGVALVYVFNGLNLNQSCSVSLSLYNEYDSNNNITKKFVWSDTGTNTTTISLINNSVNFS